MTPEKVAEAMEVMAEAQREEPPEGEPRVPCDVAVASVGEDGQILVLVSAGSRVHDALADNGFYVRTDRGVCLVEWREGACRA